MNYALLLKIGGPIILLGAVYLYGFGEGREAERGKTIAQIEASREKEFERFRERDKLAAASYERALAIVAGAHGAKPQIIERIVNAPPTECSSRPVGVERVRLLNNAIAAGRLPDTGAGGTPRREAGGFAFSTGRSDE